MADSFPLFQSGRVEVVLATYELALIHATEEVRAIRWGVLVMDEAHKLKNRETKMYKAAIELRHSSQYCVGLTGVLGRGGRCLFASHAPWCAMQARPCRTTLWSSTTCLTSLFLGASE